MAALLLVGARSLCRHGRRKTNDNDRAAPLRPRGGPLCEAGNGGD